MNSDYIRKVTHAALCMTRQCWEQGMLSYAFMLSGMQEEEELLVYDMVLRQTEDGRLCNVENTPAVTDSAFCIPAVWDMWKKSGKEEYKRAAEKNIRFLLEDAERTEDGILYHIRGTSEVWADSAAFLPYALAITGHSKEACGQMFGILGKLYREEDGLYAHMWDEATGTYPDRRAWGIGNGWILTGLIRTLGCLDEAHSAEKERMEECFKTLLDRMLYYMEENGSFHDDLTDKESFPETETVSMTACAIYRGVKEGILEGKYLASADLMRDYVLSQTKDNGLVTGSASSPTFDRPGTAVESQAHAIMMEALQVSR